MKVLVTGANGHIGAHVCRQLLEQGHKVTALVRPKADLKGLEGVDVTLCRGDVMNPEDVTAAAKGNEAIIHLAAVYKTIAKTAEEIVEPAVQGAKSVFAAATANGIQRVVYTSSVASVGFSYDPQDRRTGDDWNNDAHNPYYVAKTQSEKTAQALAKEHGIHLVVICPAIVLGPLDYRITPSNQLVMDWLNGIGQTYKGGLNLVDVRDVAAAHVAALTNGESGRRYIIGGENIEVGAIGRKLKALTGIKPMHLPTGRGLTLWTAKWVERVCRLIGVKPPFTYDLVYEVAERYAYFDTDETNETFHLQPRKAEETLKGSINWLLENHRLKPKVERQVKEKLES